ncbi:MAG: hypothetical protein Q8942_11680 [Bacillota bacterium]|nr:hypothetical protein [Bacillota bacterium]
MYCEKDCYFCKYLCFFLDESRNDFYCTISGKCYKNTFKEECSNFVLELEE